MIITMNLKVFPKDPNVLGDNEIELFALPENNDLERNPKYKKLKLTQLKLKRSITMDSRAGNSVMPKRMVRNKSKIRESEGSKTSVDHVATRANTISISTQRRAMSKT